MFGFHVERLTDGNSIAKFVPALVTEHLASRLVLLIRQYLSFALINGRIRVEEGRNATCLDCVALELKSSRDSLNRENSRIKPDLSPQ
jgi:hypothetical protein